jgi:hypothetical protein
MSASVTSGTYPRAARSATGGLQGFGHGLWMALARAGARRAQPELLRMASLRALSDPAMAAQLRAAARDLQLP